MTMADHARHGVVVLGIQEMVASGEIGPGDRLPIEGSLAARFGVSRGSLREGVRALSAMGVLETRQGSGTYVTSLDPHLLLAPLVFWTDLQAGPGARHVHVVRRALEVECAGIVARSATEEDIAACDRFLDEAKAAIWGSPVDHDAAMRADLAFHARLAASSGNPVLQALIEVLAQPTLRTRMWQSMHSQGRLEATHSEHEAILDAIRAHDAIRAQALMQSHLLAVEVLLTEAADQGAPAATTAD